MTRTHIVGDGPAGLSAGLLLAKKGYPVTVFGPNETKVHDAYLYNYPGIGQLDGSEFVETARQQCAYFGADLVDKRISRVGRDGGEFVLTDESGATHPCSYVVFTTGYQSDSADLDFEIETDDDGRFEVDNHGRTSVENVYAGGTAARGHKIQVSISVGDGAAAALDIIDSEGEAVPHDFDSRALSHLKETGPEDVPWVTPE